MNRRLLRALAIALACLTTLAFAAPAAAQGDKKWPAIRDELPSEKLKEAWDSAKELRDDGSWDAARVQYEAIHRQSKNVRVLYNVGICWKELGFFAQALGAWEKQLASREKLPPEEAKRAEQAIEVVRPFVSTLELESNQTGAALHIKGIEIGQTPFLGTIPIDVGKNELRLEKPGFLTVTRTVEVQKGKPLKLTLDMVPADKTAKVTISVAGADKAVLFMDGTELGPAPYTGELPVGKHTFEARQKGYVTATQTSELVFGESMRITLSMVKSLNEGKVRVTVDHADAVIKIEGQTVGTGSWEGLLPEGGHALVIEKAGYQTYKADIAVATDQERVFDVELEEDMTAHWIYWAVTGVVIAAGAGVASYFVLRPSEEPQVTGTLAPGVVPTNVGITIFSF